MTPYPTNMTSPELKHWDGFSSNFTHIIKIHASKLMWAIYTHIVLRFRKVWYAVFVSDTYGISTETEFLTVSFIYSPSALQGQVWPIAAADSYNSPVSGRLSILVELTLLNPLLGTIVSFPANTKLGLVFCGCFHFTHIIYAATN